jgi:hypothetical protein
MIPITMNIGIEIKVLSKENFMPKKLISKVSIGIFKAEKAPKY